MTPDWIIWQLADSAFPSGSFAHSGGLEAAMQLGLVRGDESLAGFLHSSLHQCAKGIAPFAAATCREGHRLREINEICDVFLSNHVANRASRAQGQAFHAAAKRIFHLPDLFNSHDLATAALHLAAVFGAVCGRLDLSAIQACRLFLFLSLRGAVSAVVRLGLAGPLQAQAIQNHLSHEAERYALLAEQTPLDDVCQTSPLLDLAQATHDRLYSRLFQS